MGTTSHKSGPDLCEVAPLPHTNLDQICVRPWPGPSPQPSKINRSPIENLLKNYGKNYRNTGTTSHKSGPDLCEVTPLPHTNLDQICVRPWPEPSPRAESRKPRAESREPRAESREPRTESQEPRAESRESSVESRKSRVDSRKP